MVSFATLRPYSWLIFSNYTRYPLYEPTFRNAYESVCTNGVRVHPNDIRFLPLLFVVLAIAARLAPEHIVGDERSKRLTSLRYYWSSEWWDLELFNF